MPDLRINEINYFYEVQGQGRPLLLLHGFTGSSQNWRPALPDLAAEFQTISVDVLGHGRTDSPPDENRYSIENVAADLLAILAKLNVSEIGILGYSMGGRLALFMAVAYPKKVNTLILESASPGLRTERERRKRVERDRTLADWIEMNGIEAFVSRWENLPLWASQKNLVAKVLQAQRKQRLKNNPIGLANSLRGMGTGAQPSLWGNLPQLSLPILLLSGELDQKFVGLNQEMAALLPDARLEIVPGAGHNVHLERPSHFLKLIQQFLV